MNASQSWKRDKMTLTYFMFAILFDVFAKATQFTKFLAYNNLTISNQSESFLKIQNSFQVSKFSPDNCCMLACSLASDCAVATIQQSVCTLFNNQTVLFYTVFSDNTKLFSKNEMQMCFDDFYADLTTMVCQARKLNGKSCLSTEECLSSAGLECHNGSCQCSLPDFK